MLTTHPCAQQDRISCTLDDTFSACTCPRRQSQCACARRRPPCFSCSTFSTRRHTPQSQPEQFTAAPLTVCAARMSSLRGNIRAHTAVAESSAPASSQSDSAQQNAHSRVPVAPPTLVASAIAGITAGAGTHSKSSLLQFRAGNFGF